MGVRTKATPYDTTEETSSEEAVQSQDSSEADVVSAAADAGEEADAHNGDDAAGDTLNADMAKWTKNDWSTQMMSENTGFAFTFDAPEAPLPTQVMAAVPAPEVQQTVGVPCVVGDVVDMHAALRAARKTIGAGFCKSQVVDEATGKSATTSEWRNKRKAWKGSQKHRPNSSSNGAKRVRTE